MTLKQKYLAEYGAWKNARLRCSSLHHQGYKYYGGRGIKMCKAWISSFETFLNAVGPKPTPSHTLDRYPNNNGDYEPGNVRWATMKQQASNARHTKPLDWLLKRPVTGQTNEVSSATNKG